MEVRSCPNCGAPLPASAPGSVEHCRFCGAEGRELEGAAPGAPIVPTGAPLLSPLWMYGMREAGAWLLPRAPTTPPIVVMAVTDAYPREEIDQPVVNMSAALLAETIWMTTDAPATTGHLVALALRKIYNPGGPLPGFAVYEPILRQLRAEGWAVPVVVWGSAKEDLHSQGIEWRARVPGQDAEQAFSGPVAESMTAIVSWLVDRGFARHVQPPAWWTPPWGEILRARVEVMDCLRVQIFAANGVVSVEKDWHTSFADQALHLAEAHPGEVHTMLAAASAHHAGKAGALTPTLKKRAMTLIESHPERGLPVRRLSPHWLASLAGEEAGRARRAEMEVDASGAYAEWLRRIATPETE